MTNPRLVLVENYGAVGKLPVNSYFCFVNGWTGSFDDNAQPYLLCKKTGNGTMAFVIVEKADTAEHAKHRLMKLIQQGESSGK
jgi:hypothetical protein